MSVKLCKSALEWRNHSQDDYVKDGSTVSMQTLKARVLKLKEQYSYVQVWSQLASMDIERHAGNEEYISRLIYLVDERPVPISVLQRSVSLQLGHLFRTLDRADVDFRAHTHALTTRIRGGYWPWPCEMYVDVMNGQYFRAGEAHALPEGVDILRRDSDEYGAEQGDPAVDDGTLGLIDGNDEVPLPLYPGLRERLGPPVYRRACG